MVLLKAKIQNQNMSLRPIKTPQDLLDFFQEEREVAQDLRDKINEDLGNKRISLITDRKKFFQNIALGSITFLGFVSAFATISESDPFSNNYFIVGVGLHLLLICFVFLYMREAIDVDLFKLVESQDRYAEVTQNKINLVERYYLEFLKNPQDVKAYLGKYIDELHNLPTITQLREENFKLDKERKERRSGEAFLEFYGEFIVFFFITGTLLIFFAISGKSLNFIFQIWIGIIIFYLSFTDSLAKLTKPAFRIIKFVTRYNLIK